MKLRIFRGALVLLMAAVAAVAVSQEVPVEPVNPSQSDVKLPNGKSQRDEILKMEHEENIKDSAHLVELAQSLHDDLVKNDPFVLSMDTLKKTDEIEKLVKKIRSRLRH